jgi:hypothetical protein
MGDKISDLPASSTIASTDVLLKSNAAGSTQIITFDNFQTNFNFLRSTGSNTMQIGVSDYALPVIRIPSNNKYVGIGGGSNFVPSSIVHISGYTGQNAIITLQAANGYTGYFKFNDSYCPWYIANVPSGKFFISGDSNDTYFPSLTINTDGKVLITDASQYSVANTESGVSMQFFAATGLRMSFDNNTNSNDYDFNYSGISSEKDFYINYHPSANMASGTFVGLSGSVFIDADFSLTRVGNNATRFPDARLMVTNDTTNGTTYKTCVIEDTANPNLYFRKVGQANTASFTFDPSTTQLYLAKNNTPASISSTDPFIFDVSNARLGVGGVDPTYPLDVTGNNGDLVSRYQSASQNLIHKYQSNFPGASGPIDSIFTTYSSGLNNNMLVGYRFESSKPYGDAGRVGEFFFQTGDTNNTSYSSRDIASISDKGDLDISRYYSTNNDFSQGKFIQVHRTSCSETYKPVYLNLDNINYDYQSSGSLAYHSLCPLSGQVIGVDFTCQLNSGISNGTGYLVFNKFADAQLTNVGGIAYVSGTTVDSAPFYQLWNASTNAFKNPNDINPGTQIYVSGIITGQGFLNLQARRSNTTVNQKFNGLGTDRLRFNKFDSISWVAYAVTNPASPQITILTGAKNLTTTVSYFVESDTATEGGTYINQ